MSMPWKDPWIHKLYGGRELWGFWLFYSQDISWEWMHVKAVNPPESFGTIFLSQGRVRQVRACRPGCCPLGQHTWLPHQPFSLFPCVACFPERHIGTTLGRQLRESWKSTTYWVWRKVQVTGLLMVNYMMLGDSTSLCLSLFAGEMG